MTPTRTMPLRDPKRTGNTPIIPCDPTPARKDRASKPAADRAALSKRKA